MSLIDAEFVYGTGGYGTEGFTFSVLGDLLPDGSGYQARSQGANPKFTADYNGNAFVPYVEYKFIGQHPDIANDPILVRYTFDANGKGIPSSPAEDPTNTTVTTSNTDTLDEVTGRTADFSAVIATDFFTAWLPQEIGGFLLRKISAAATWVVLIGALTEVLIDSLKEKLTYELEDLTKLNTIRDITINGSDGNDTVLTPGGVRVNEPGGLFSFIGRSFTGAIQLINHGGYSFFYQDNSLTIDATILEAPNADTALGKLALADLQPATEPDMVLVAQPSPIPGRKDVRSFTFQDLATAQLPYLDYQAIKDKIDELDKGEEVPGDARLPHQILCFDTPESVLLTQDFIITPELVNVPVGHRLNMDGASIFPTLVGADNKDATGYMTITFSGLSQFSITPDDGTSYDFYGKLNLRTILT